MKLADHHCGILNFFRWCFAMSMNDEREVGDESFIGFICAGVEKARKEGTRLVINMPPRHLKSSFGAVCLSAWLASQSTDERENE